MLLKERLNNNYDFLRVFAALCITFTHSYDLILKNDDEPLMKFSGNRFDFSFIGLSIFFSISGYLIAKSAITSPSFKNYIWKRFLRIQPMLILVCLASILVIGPIFTSLSLNEFFKQESTFTYFRNIMPLFGIQFVLPAVFGNNPAESGVNGSLWTLIVEERLYLIIGILFLFKQYGKALLLILIGILNLLYFINVAFYGENLIKYFSGQNVFYAIIFLNASAFYLVNIDFKKIANSLFYLIFFASLLLLSTVIIFEKSLQMIFIPILILSIAHLKGKTNKAGKYGDFTYGIYIFSFPVQQILIAKNIALNNPLKLFGMTILIVLPLAILCWHLLEKKMLLFKVRFT